MGLTKFIFITGGVVSSLGKGLAAAALGAVLKERGFKVRIRKLDPYLNVDPGTMSPLQHGECFVTDDGAETDLDLGHYERFLDISSKQSDNITTGKIYSNIIEKERRGEYLGQTVQVIPHVTNEIKKFILGDIKDEDFIICEIGGTVGDIESTPFLESIRQLKADLEDNRCIFLHVTLLPFIKAAGEIKTKPTQHSVKEMLSIGIQPDILLCRSDIKIPEKEKEKIALFCNVKPKRVIPALNVKSIYETPITYHKEGLDKEVLNCFLMKEDAEKKVNLSKWSDFIRKIDERSKEITIAMVGKYIGLADAYKSLLEALEHAGVATKTKININWIDAEKIKKINDLDSFKNIDGILIPGGFGERGAEGKIKAIEFARINKIPFLGICLGMQLAVIEAARNTGIQNAGSSEWQKENHNVVGIMKGWTKNNKIETRTENSNKGGTLRLGAYPCVLEKKSLAYDIYKTQNISERHRHRFEILENVEKNIKNLGIVFSGKSPDGKLPEILENINHPWFIGVQFHPELKSRPFSPHPLFVKFLEAMIKYKNI